MQIVKKIYRKLKFYLRLKKIAGSVNLADFDIFNNNKYNLSFFLLVKNGAKYLNEWLAYHYSIGIEHFYIINDMSCDDTKKVLEPWKKLGIVSVMDFKINAMQNEIYTYFSSKLINSTKWLGFLDLDEFLVIKNKENAVDWVNSFPTKTSAIEINWCCFGSSGLEKYENIFVTKRFKKYSDENFEPNIQVKSILKLGEKFAFLNPHTVFSKTLSIRNSNGELIKQDFFHRKPVLDKAWINHYFCLSKEEFAEKINLGRVDSKKSIRTWQDFEWHDINDCSGDKSLEKANEQIENTLKELGIIF